MKTVEKISSVLGMANIIARIITAVSMILCIGFLSFDSCVFPYEPEVDKYDNLLVVEGLLTNLHGSCKVKLSHTYPYDGRKYKTESGAKVKIIDDLGNEMIFVETEKGLYVPEDTNFVGYSGMKYKLTIETVNGELFHSGFEELKEPVEIGNIYPSYVDKGKGIKGLQLYLDTYDPFEKSFYYSWEYKETWEFWVPYVSRSVYLPEMKICYKHVNSNRFLFESTKNYINDKVVGFPLIFIDNQTNRLSVKYSILVTQYILTENTYLFYKNLRNINENVGTLFDRTPITLVGNIRNTLYPDKPVLGNFQVSGASEKRIFILNIDLPSELIIPTEYENCEARLLDIKRDKLQLDTLIMNGWVAMDTIVEDINPEDTLYGMVNSRSCFDCTTAGDINMPYYWNMPF